MLGNRGVEPARGPGAVQGTVEHLCGGITAHHRRAYHHALPVLHLEPSRRCRKRKDNSTENFAILRLITLNILKQDKTCRRSIAGKRLLAGWDTNYMEKVPFSG